MVTGKVAPYKNPENERKEAHGKNTDKIQICYKTSSSLKNERFGIETVEKEEDTPNRLFA